MIRVLLVTTMYPVPGNPALGAFVAEQVRSLTALGLTMDVVFLNCWKSRLAYAGGVPKIARALLRKQYHLIHTHHTYSFVLSEIARGSTRRHLPIVLTSHEGEALNGAAAATFLRPVLALRQSVRLKRMVASRADFVIFVSRLLSEKIAPSAPFDIIPCGVDLGKFRPLEKRACRSQLALPLGVPLVFFPARPGARGKRFELAARALEIMRRSVPEVRLITGGEIPHEQMPLYYNAADVVLQASFYEASPTIVKEALACEVPVVSTDSGDSRELLEGVPNCGVFPDDPYALAAGVLAALGRPAEGARAHLSRKGLALEQVAGRVASVYERVLRPEG